MKKRNNLTTIECTGYNITKFINICLEKEVALENAIRKDSKTLIFSLNDNNLKKFNKLDIPGYTFKEIAAGGVKSLKNKLIYRCGLIIGLILSVISFIFINNRLFNIEISGLYKYKKEEVVLEINNFGINYFSKLNLDTKKLEEHLTNKFDFSFVSVITKGSSLIINVKEEISDISNKYIPITAEENMVIKKINVYAGFSNLKEGDIVYKGDTLIYPYEVVNNEQIPIMPMGEILGDIFFSSRYIFRNEEIKRVRSGNREVIEEDIYLGKNSLYQNRKDTSFQNYECEEESTQVSYYFLPIKIVKKVAYEIIEEKVQHNFEEEKENIISTLKEDVYKKVPKDLPVEDEEIVISSTNYGNIVTIYLKSSVYLNYK